MKHSILKLLSVVGLAVLMTGLCSCGEKSPNTEAAEYEYRSTFTSYKTINSKGYTSVATVQNGIVTYINVDSFDEPFNYSLRSRNLETGEELSAIDLKVPSQENIYFMAMNVIDDNSVAVMGEFYDETKLSENLKCYSIDKAGNLTIMYELENPGNRYGGYVNDVCFDGKEVVFTSDTYFVRLDEKGNEVFSVRFDDWISDFCIDKNGNTYVLVYGANGKTSLYEIEKGKTQEKLLNKFSGVTNICIAKDGSMYGYSQDTFGKLDIEAGTYNEFFQWINIDVTEPYFVYEEIISDEELSFLMQKWEESGTAYERCDVKLVEKADENSRIELIFGCQYADYQVKDEIAKFNKHNDKYRIVVKEYLGQGVDDVMKAYERFEMDVASGMVFNLVETSFEDAEKYSKKGYYANLGELMDADASFNRKDYIESILSLFETNGKLYIMPLSVYAQTMAMPKSLADTIDKWDVDSLISLKNKYPDIPLVDGYTKEYVLLDLLMYSYDDFVDANTGECSFDGDEFIKCLEFANAFPEVIDTESYDNWSEIMKGNIKMTGMFVMNFDEASLYRQLFGEELSYIGYPSKNGGRHFISGTNNVSISAKSKQKEGAWEFIKQLLGYDFQYNNYNGFPILLSAFNDKIEAEKAKPKDETFGTWGNGFITVQLHGASDEDIEAIADIVKNANAVMSIDEKIYTIVDEETRAFFEGKKSAKEVADIIQSRVKIYLAETR